MQGKGGIKYKWTPAKYLENDTLANTQARLPENQLYDLVVSNEYGCKDSAQVWLKVRPPLKAAITILENVQCTGDTLLLAANGSGGMPGNYQYYWPKTGRVADTIKLGIIASGWHKVIMRDGCSEEAQDSIFIKLPIGPVASFYTPQGNEVLAGAVLNFINTSRNADRYRWTFAPQGSISEEKNPTYSWADTGAYKVCLIAENNAGCRDSSCQYFHVSEDMQVYIPNAFSPGADRLNDLFSISGTGIASYSYDIYNRWGECIFSSSAAKPDWDGRMQGTLVPMDVYLYKLKVTGVTGHQEFYSGLLHVIR